MPYIRLVRQAQTGRISLAHMRRWRVDVGAFAPAWLAEALGGLALVLLVASVQRMLSLAGLRVDLSLRNLLDGPGVSVRRLLASARVPVP